MAHDRIGVRLCHHYFLFNRNEHFSPMLPDQFIDQASPEAMYAAAGLTADKIAVHALRMIGVESLQMHRGGAM